MFGAAYDGQMRVRHRGCHTVEALSQLRGSKYVQSEIGSVFREIKTLLAGGEQVLFVGTPCQVAGLRAYLKKGLHPPLVC